MIFPCKTGNVPGDAVAAGAGEQTMAFWWMYKIKLAMVPLFIEMKISIHMYIYVYIHILWQWKWPALQFYRQADGFLSKFDAHWKIFPSFCACLVPIEHLFGEDREGRGMDMELLFKKHIEQARLSHLRKWFGPEISYTPKRKRKKNSGKWWPATTIGVKFLHLGKEPIWSRFEFACNSGTPKSYAHLLKSHRL